MKAYFDESGKHKSAHTITIFGLLMSSDTCKELQRRWFREAAKAPAIPLPFHMSDCVVGRKAYAYLRDDEPLRLQMQERMIKTWRGLDMQAYGIAVDRRPYEESSEVLRPNVTYQDPWFLAFEGSIMEMMVGSAESGKKHHISLVFDRQDEFKKRAHQLYDEILKSEASYTDRLGSLSFSPKDKIAALQAVDVVTYEATRYLTDTRLEGRPERKQMDWIRQVITVQGRIIDKSGVNLLKEGIVSKT